MHHQSSGRPNDSRSGRLGTSRESQVIAPVVPHTVAARLKQADVQEHVIAELLGHEHEHISTSRYWKKVDARRPRETVNRPRGALSALLK
jgi:integrase